MASKPPSSPEEMDRSSDSGFVLIQPGRCTDRSPRLHPGRNAERLLEMPRHVRLV